MTHDLTHSADRFPTAAVARRGGPGTGVATDHRGTRPIAPNDPDQDDPPEVGLSESGPLGKQPRVHPQQAAPVAAGLVGRPVEKLVVVAESSTLPRRRTCARPRLRPARAPTKPAGHTMPTKATTLNTRSARTALPITSGSVRAGRAVDVDEEHVVAANHYLEVVLGAGESHVESAAVLSEPGGT